MPKVFVSGCFDMLHSGHIAFLEEAAGLGDLYVGVARDQTIVTLKGRVPVNGEQERLYMIKALKSVKDAWVCSGLGMMEFIDEVKALRPDIFFVNTDGVNRDKEKLCEELGIKLVVSERVPHAGMPQRSTTSCRKDCHIPYRVNIAGAWLDQPMFSRLGRGSVLTVSVEPTIEFFDLAGMATSTRKKAIELWETRFPAEDPVKVAKLLFAYENPPGKASISGSQDALGMAMPAFNKLTYNGEYWPCEIAACHDESVLSWLERHVGLVFVRQRYPDYNPYAGADITPAKVERFAHATNDCWNAALERDFKGFSKAFLAAFEAQAALLPAIRIPEAEDVINERRTRAAAWNMMGAGGGGYMAFVTEEPTHDMIRFRIRRKDI